MLSGRDSRKGSTGDNVDLCSHKNHHDIQTLPVNILNSCGVIRKTASQLGKFTRMPRHVGKTTRKVGDNFGAQVADLA